MCLIILAHNASPSFPLIIAANRDEAHARATEAATFWADAPDVLGGRDAVQGGTWLAIAKNGRFAAVTNLRGEGVPGARSRGFLVRDFVLSGTDAADYTLDVARDDDQYGGFHLIAGAIGDTVMHHSSASAMPRPLPNGIHGISNGPPDSRWPKVVAGEKRVAELLRGALDPEAVARELLTFLGTPSADAKERGATLREEAESEPFILGEEYGTRSSTVIVATALGDVLFVEKSYGPGGAPVGAARGFRFPVEAAKPMILIADDDVNVRALIARSMREEGFDVMEVAGGNEAIAVLGQRRVALVILDLIMANGSGADVLAHLESKPNAPRAIIVSSLAQTWSKRRGGTDHLILPKPVDLALLRAAARKSVTGSMV